MHRSMPLRASSWRSCGLDPRAGSGRLRDNLPPRDPENALAICLEQRLALRIVLSSELVIVPSRAVGLDDEVMLWPPEVRNDTATLEDQRPIDIGVGEPACQDEVKDQVLELGTSGCRTLGHDPP